MKHFRHNCPPKINVKSIWRILLNLLAIRTAFGLSSSWRLQPLNFRGVHLLDRDYSNYNYCVRLLHDHHFGQTAEFLVQHHHTQRQRQRLRRRVHRTAYQHRSHDDFAEIRTSRCDDDRLSIVPEATFSPIRSSLAPEPLNYSTRRKIILSMLSWGGMASVTSLLSEGAEALSLFPDDVNDVSAFPPSSALPPTNENEPLEAYQSILGDKERYPQASSTRKKFRRNYHPLKTSVVQKLWDLDDNRLVPNVDYKINVQAGKTLRRKEPNSNSRTVNGNFSDDSESDSYGDVAPLPLFNYVNPSILSNKNSPPLQKQQDSQSASKSSKSYITYQLFLSLLDNYNADESIPETTTDQEYDEIMLFLNAIMDTRPMKFCHEYCYHRQIELMKKMVEIEDANGGEMQHTKGGAKKQNNEMIAIIPPDREGFIQLLYSIWFDYYRRQRPKNRKSSSVMGKNSCGFEHVFVGEVKPTRKRATSNLGTTDSVNATGKSDGSNDKGAVVGFHNWMQFYVEEMKGNLDYRGFIIRPATATRDGFGSEEPNTASCPLDRNETVKSTQNSRILTLQFQWNGSEKPLSTMFVGTSPEFEMALYTMAFLVGESNNRVTLNTTTPFADDDSAAGGVFDLNIKCFRIGADEEEVEDPHDTGNEIGANGIQWRIGSAFVEDMNHC